MPSLIQDSAFGQLMRLATGNKAFAHAETKPDFELPWKNASIDDASSDKEKDTESNNGILTGQHGAEPPVNDGSLARHDTEVDPERQGSQIGQQTSRVLTPKKTPDGVILVDWYTTDDPVNPFHWTTFQKNVVVFIIALYTFGVYSSSAIVTPAHGEIMERFNVNYSTASLTLALYVLGYGIGPLVSRLRGSLPLNY
jgi:MFS transporter, DHA1 family, multidrug resistance protein